jgi:hypothetical protein
MIRARSSLRAGEFDVTLRLKRGAVERMVWSKPDSIIAPFCSLCQVHIGDDAVPLKMWNSKGACVQFCETCIENIFEQS